MYTRIDKDNIHKEKEQSKVKSTLVYKLNHWLAKIGQALNTEQQSNHK